MKTKLLSSARWLKELSCTQSQTTLPQRYTKGIARLYKLVGVLVLLFSISIGNAWGGKYTYNFNSVSGWYTTSAKTTNVSTGNTNNYASFYDTNGVLWSAGGTSYYFAGSYYLLGKSGAYLVLPKFAGEKITSVVLTGSTGHSTSVKVNIYTLSGTAASTEQTWSKKGQDHTYSINASYQASRLMIKVTNAYNTQFTKVVINTATASAASCDAIDVTGGSAVILPAGSTTYTTGAWKTAGAPTAYAAEAVYSIGDYCVTLTQVGDNNYANGLQFQASNGVLLLEGITSTLGVDVEFLCSGTNGFQVELTGAATLTGQTGTVTISTTETNADLIIRKNTANAGNIKYIKITPKLPPCNTPTSPTNSSISSTGFTAGWTAPSPAPGSGYLVAYSSSSTAPGTDVTSTGGSYTVASVASGTSKAFTGLTAGNTYYWWVRSNCGSSNYSDWTSATTIILPKITASKTITGLNYAVGSGPSAAQSFTVSAVGLTGNLTVTAPTNFEVSTTSGSGYGSSVTLTASGSGTCNKTISSATVYVRLKSGLSQGSYGASNITISGGGAANNTSVSVAGVVSAACSAPSISVHPTGGVSYNMNVTATALSITASGTSLTYQWYSNTSNSNTTGSAIDGATSSTYTPPTSAAGTKYYYCVVSSGACSTSSNTAAITVNTPTITVSETTCAFGDRKTNGGPYELSLTVSGATLAKDQGIGLAITGTNAGMFAIKGSVTNIAQTSTGTVATTTVTVQYSPTAAGSHSATLTFSSTGATNKTVALSGTGKWEVTWNNNGATSTMLVANSAKPTFPSTPSSCDGTSTTFIGWATASWSGKLASLAGKTVHTSNSTMSAVTANGTTYYAVFAKATGGAGTVHTLTKSNTSWSGYTSSTQNDNQSATWSYYAGGVNNSGTYYWALNTNANNYNIGSPKFSQNVTAISIWVKNPAASARNVYICSSNETAQPTSGDLGSKSIPGSGEEEYSIDNLTGSFDQFYIYVSAALNIKYVKVTVGGTTYSDYMTTCCDKNISWSAPTITGTGATITFNKTSPVATCAGTTTIQATLTLTAGYQATALSFSGGSVSVSPAISLPVNATTTYTLTFAGNTNATLTTTATIAAKPLSSISLSPTSGTVYVGQYAEFAITYDPTDILTKGTTLDGTPSYCVTTGTTNTTLKITGGKAGASITEDKTETVTIKASADNTKKASVSITVKPLPYVSFVDNIHNKTDFGGLTDGKVTATIVANALVKTQKTPVHADLAEPATGNDCEKSHLHLVGWIESTWADEHPAATKSAIEGAGAGNFYTPNADIDVDAQKGKTYLAVWSTIE